MDDGTYMIEIKGAQVEFDPPVGFKGDAYEEANEQCGRENKAVETIKLEEVIPGFGRSPAVSLKFRCVDPGTSTPAKYSTNAIADSRAAEKTGSAEDPCAPDDLYSKLLKLDDLRKRGILTDEEFAQEKKELLEAN